jgi:hypothetical protein
LSGRRPLVIDANVLIDYLIAAPKVLALARDPCPASFVTMVILSWS